MADTKKLSSVDRLFLNTEYQKYVDKNLYEEDFYDTTTEISSYFDRVNKRKNRDTNTVMFEDPVFFSVYEPDKMVKDLDNMLEGKEHDPHQNDEDEVYESPRKRRARLQEEQKQRELLEKHVRKAEKKEQKKRKKARKKLSKFDKQKIALTVSLIFTLILIIGLVIGFIMAYKYSDSKTYVLKRDRQAPTATTKDQTIFGYETLDISDFISDIKDETEVKAEFVNPIDYNAEGSQKVEIRLTDEAGNSSVVEANLTIIHDTKAPEIICEPLIRVTTGQTVAYKSFVVVHDDYDDDPKIKVDNSKVDLSEEGIYKVKYTATDKSGNKASVICRIEVSPSNGSVNEKDVWELVDATLSWVIDDSMDDIHKVWAVYEYVNHIPYALTDYSYDYMYEGYKILHDNKGDCYGSFAAAKLMLDRLGFDTIPIETIGNTRHFWNMVSIDGGKHWYHVDATNWVEWGYHPVMCMISTGDLMVISDEHRGTHVYDIAAYPQTPKKSMPVPDDIEEIYGYDY